MGYLQILVFVIFGVALLWFGYNMLIGQWDRIRAVSRFNRAQKLLDNRINPEDPQSCPICSVKLYRGELVNTLAFPSITGGQDRLMHVLGCVYCIGGAIKRKCPVCGSKLHHSEFLVARLFERKHRRNHVHILGCIHCRKR